jgi:hypothetical protein
MGMGMGKGKGKELRVFLRPWILRESFIASREKTTTDAEERSTDTFRRGIHVDRVALVQLKTKGAHMAFDTTRTSTKQEGTN